MDLMDRECSVCKESGKPCTYGPCTHSVCLECFANMADTARMSSYGNPGIVNCPLCRVTICHLRREVTEPFYELTDNLRNLSNESVELTATVVSMRREQIELKHRVSTLSIEVNNYIEQLSKTVVEKEDWRKACLAVCHALIGQKTDKIVVPRPAKRARTDSSSEDEDE